MAEVRNHRKQTRTFKTRLNNMVAALTNKNYDIDENLAGQPRIDAIREQLTTLRDDAGRLSRAIESLRIRHTQYMEFVDNAADENILNEYNIFADAEAFEDVETAAHDCMDLLEGKNVRYTDELNILEEPPNRRNSLEAHEVPHRARAAAPAAAADARSGLPKLPPKKFSGNPARWTSFWQGFNSTVGEKEIPNHEKLAHLLNALQPPALNAVEGYAITNENYPIVVRRLQTRYGRKDLVIDALNKELRHIKKAGSSIPEIRDTWDAVTAVLLQLKSHERDINQDQTEIIVKEKLPEWIRVKCAKAKSADDAWNLDKLMDKVESILSLREQSRAEYTEKSDSKPRNPSPKPAGKPKRNNFSQGGAYVTAGKDDARRTKRNKCTLCEATDHYPSDCTQYETFGVRARRLQAINRCCRCLRTGHDADSCEVNRKCLLCNADDHHPVFCPKNFSSESNCNKSSNQGKKKGGKKNDAAEKNSKSHPENSSNGLKRIPFKKAGGVCSVFSHKRGETEVILSFVKAEVCNPSAPDERQTALVLLDSASSFSFIEPSFINKLKLQKADSKWLSIGVFGSNQPEHKRYNQYNIGLCQSSGISSILVNESDLTLKTVTLTEPLKRALDSYSLSIGKNDVARPNLLIGADHFWDIVTGRVERLPSGFWLLNSTLGPIITGTGHIKSSKFSKTGLVEEIISEQNECVDGHIDDTLQKFWTLDSIGIKDDPSETDSERAMDSFLKTIEWDSNEKRYAVRWPWKDENIPANLHSNYGLSLGRLKGIWNKLSANPDSLVAYAKKFEEDLELGLIEDAPEVPDGVMYYMPHHPVINYNKLPLKPRTVFDAGSKIKTCVSLNDCLYAGPVLLPELCGMLLRFRKAPIIITSDVQKAFHQILMQRSERDSVRFLWLRDPMKPPDAKNIRHMRWRRMPFGVISAPFLLAATLRYHFERKCAIETPEVYEDTYADNVMSAADNKKQALKKCAELKTTFADMGMNLREFFSNCPQVMEQFADDPAQTETKFMGLKWDLKSDTLKITFPPPPEKAPTKRIVLKTVAKLFDPLGIASPTVVWAKLLIQFLWSQKKGWDEPIDKIDEDEWNAFLKEFCNNYIVIPRRVPITKTSTNELHVFTDASGYAFACSVFIRVLTKGNIDVKLLFAKSRIRPMKDVTIPRMELLGTVLGIRAILYVKNQIKVPISKMYLWSDSKCVLCWILGKEKQQKRFIENRLREVKRDDVEYRFVPTSHNPADIGSRGMMPEELKSNSLWWNGPQFLQTDPSNWPPLDIYLEMNEEAEISYPLLLVEKILDIESPAQPKLYKAEFFSSWNRLKHSIALVLTFMKRASSHSTKLRDLLLAIKLDVTTNRCTYREFIAAEKIIFRQMQRQQPPSCKEIAKLNIVTSNDGIMRCKGRFGPNVNWPIYLPTGTIETKLIILDAHIRSMHAGMQQTLSLLRNDFWIIHGRAIVKRVIKRECMICRKLLAKPYALPPMAELPIERTSLSRVFQHIGLDYLGPLYTKDASNTHIKVWINLYTCMTTRAIHLEVVESLSTQCFIYAFRRFVSRRGMPNLTLSDNAPNSSLLHVHWIPFGLKK